MFSRRNFLKLGLATGLVALCSNTFEIYRTTHRLLKPTTDLYEVLVIGGGPAGVGAAITAAREGCRVALVESSGYLGGMGSIGLVSSFVETWSAQGIYGREIIGNVGRSFDPRRYDYLLKQKIDEEITIDLFLHTKATGVIMEGSQIKGVNVQQPDSSFQLHGTTVVDATGNGDIFAWAGAPWRTGRESKAQHGEQVLGRSQADNQVQGHSLCCILEEKEGTAHLLPKPTNYDPQEFAHFIFEDDSTAWNPVDDYFWQATWYPVNFGDSKPRYLINHIHVYGNTSSLQPAEVTALQIEASARLQRFVYYLQHQLGKTTWGVVDCFGAPLGFAPVLGIRESRRLEGEYLLTENDLLQGTIPNDTIALVSQIPDIHVCSPAEENDREHTRGYGYTWPKAVQRTFQRNGGCYGIPYRSLLPVEVDSLIVAGRCISGTHIAQSSYRMQPYCYNQGEAAGMAAALAVQTKTRLRDLNVAYLQKKLLANYALLYNFADIRNYQKDYPIAAIAVLYQALQVDAEHKVNLDTVVTKRELLASLCRVTQTQPQQPLLQSSLEAPATRLELAQLAVQMFDLPAKASSNFPNVSANTSSTFMDLPDPLQAQQVGAFLTQPVLEDYQETLDSGYYRPTEAITRRTLAYTVAGMLAPAVKMPQERVQGPLEYGWIYLFGNRSYRRLNKMLKPRGH